MKEEYRLRLLFRSSEEEEDAVLSSLLDLGFGAVGMRRLSSQVVGLDLVFYDESYVEDLKKSEVYRRSVDLDTAGADSYIIYADGTFFPADEWDADEVLQWRGDDFRIEKVPEILCEDEDTIYAYLEYKGWV